MVTVTAVQVTADVAHARVRFHAPQGQGATPRRPSASLGRTAGFLRSQLAHRLKLYQVPQLKFVYDDLSMTPACACGQFIDAAIEAHGERRE